jgi:hypothetical protein
MTLKRIDTWNIRQRRLRLSVGLFGSSAEDGLYILRVVCGCE